MATLDITQIPRTRKLDADADLAHAQLAGVLQRRSEDGWQMVQLLANQEKHLLTVIWAK